MGMDTWVPFTIDQWQELELQALVFKYLILSEPVPLNLVRLVCKLVDPPAVLPAQYLAQDREEQLRALQRSIGEEAEAKRQVSSETFSSSMLTCSHNCTPCKKAVCDGMQRKGEGR